MELLRLRRVPLTEADADASAALSSLPDLCADVRALAEADRDVMEKGTRAFVSWVGASPPLICALYLPCNAIAPAPVRAT